jgi:hypothetical protein
VTGQRSAQLAVRGDVPHPDISSLPEASVFPSGLKAKAKTPLVSALIVAPSGRCVATSNSCTLLSSLVDASVLESAKAPLKLWPRRELWAWLNGYHELGTVERIVPLAFAVIYIVELVRQVTS